VEESEQNRQTFEEIKSIWLKSQNIHLNETVKFDKAAAWNKVKPRGNLQAQRSLWSIWMPRIAASFIIILLGFVAYLYLQENPLPQEFVATEDNKVLTLPDGSIVTLEAGASIKYLEDFAAYRNLEFKGLGYFDVVASKESPFKIITSDLEVEVIGTEFYVNTNQDDYGVGVSSGVVTVKDKQGKQKFELKKDQMIAYDAIGKKFGPLENLNPNQLYWRSGSLEFTSTPLSEVLLTLEESFGVEIEYIASEDTPCLFSGRFKDAELNEILDQLALSLNLEIRKDETITIVSSKCTQ
jgi:transmembrane sensor